MVANEHCMCWLQVVLILLVDGSADNSLSPTVIFFKKNSYLEELLENCVVYNFQNSNSVAWVRGRTITTEQPPLVGEVSANFCG
jgi:hypothetical protein